MPASTVTGKSRQIAVRIPFDVLIWLEKEAGPCRGIATMVNNHLRAAFDEAHKKKPARK